MQPVSPFLLPVVALVTWTLVMLGWMAAVRGRATRSRRINIFKSVGGRGQDLEGRIEPRETWPAHNHTHLHEQPTLFYAVCLTLAMLGERGEAAVALAWAYVALRVAHSLYQATVNRVAVRFPLFILGTAALAGLTGIALARLL